MSGACSVVPHLLLLILSGDWASLRFGEGVGGGWAGLVAPDGGEGGGGFGPARFDFSGLDISSRKRDYEHSAQPRKLGNVAFILTRNVWPDVREGWLPELR